MNRLVLVGNGFDLAHGLKTSYNDFILWYIKKCYVKAFDKGNYKDNVLEINKNYQYNGTRIVDFDDVIEFIEASYKDGFTNLGQYLFNLGNDYSNRFPFHTQMNEFMKALLQNCSYTRWVDIEAEFYDQLKKILKKDDAVNVKEANLLDLNQTLKYIINQLKEYLQTLAPAQYNEEYMRILTSNIIKTEVHGISIEVEEEPENTLILNFNYTNSLNPYIGNYYRRSSRAVPNINYIHGQLGDKLNPLIFGFGDELDDDYLKMERERAKGYFDYIKSFWYFRTSNYRELTRFIESDTYQVYILGHSCGLSDRTMLHMIFEHSNCKSIKIYYHGTKENNNYTAITYDIARHFKNKEEMRNKIVSLDQSLNMPQAT